MKTFILVALFGLVAIANAGKFERLNLKSTPEWDISGAE